MSDKAKLYNFIYDTKNADNTITPKQVLTYMFTDGEWKTVVPYIYTSGQWKPCAFNSTVTPEVKNQILSTTAFYEENDSYSGFQDFAEYADYDTLVSGKDGFVKNPSDDYYYAQDVEQSQCARQIIFTLTVAKSSSLTIDYDVKSEATWDVLAFSQLNMTIPRRVYNSGYTDMSNFKATISSGSGTTGQIDYGTLSPGTYTLMAVYTTDYSYTESYGYAKFKINLT